MRVAVAVLAVLVASTTLLRGGSALARPGATGISDWPEFGYDPARQNVGPASPGITVANVGRLRRHRIQIDGTVDSSAIYLHQVIVGGKTQLFANVIYDNIGVANNLPFAAAAAVVPVLAIVVYLVLVRRTGALENL